jgi:hypothetical protein
MYKEYTIPGPVFPEDELDFKKTGITAASVIKGEKVTNIEEAISLLEADLNVREEKSRLIIDAEIREGLNEDIAKRKKQIETLRDKIPA